LARRIGSMNSPRVCIIVLNWNGLEDTVECLESLQKVTYPDYHVVVVDNGSAGQDARTLRERFGGWAAVVENERNYGYAGGNNIGIRYAVENYNPSYLLLLNNDTVVDPEFLASMVEVAGSDPAIGIVGPKIYSYDERDRIQSAGGSFDWWSLYRSVRGAGLIDRGQLDQVTEVDWVSGSALLISREAVENVGLLYPAYFVYSEEVDWCARCKRAGYKVVFAPMAKLWHKCAWTPRGMGKLQLYYIMRNRYIFMKRNATQAQFVFFFVHYTLRSLFVSPFSIALRQRNPGLLPTFYRAVFAGIASSVTGSRGSEERL
jgi:GT2 family glycosyltransferase